MHETKLIRIIVACYFLYLRFEGRIVYEAVHEDEQEVLDVLGSHCGVLPLDGLEEVFCYRVADVVHVLSLHDHKHAHF